jgi:phosphomannomutase
MVGWDLRPSSPGIAAVVLGAVQAAGLRAIRAGAVPTPALALAAAERGAAAIMVTGSHIPAERKGLKFYVPGGEISKAHEAAILGARGRDRRAADAPAAVEEAADAGARYARRYLGAYGGQALAGMRIGVYQHSSVARDLMGDILSGLGAEVVALGRSDVFIPVDTEAVDPETRALIAGWCAGYRLDALVSTDGDADRPLLADATGEVVPGDVLGAITAQALGARIVCTPVSSNSMIAALPGIEAVHLTRIGSPHVIAAMEAARVVDGDAAVVGYEANGGFLLGFDAPGPAGRLAPLMTRDCMLPIVAVLAAARAGGLGVADLVAALPPRFTAADRIKEVPTEASASLIAALSADAVRRQAFFDGLGPEAGVDLTDGLRVRFADGAVVHLRPSGNAPECRCYAEAESPARARALVARHLGRLAAVLGNG